MAVIVAGGDPTPVLELGEEAPYLVALPVEELVVGIRDPAAL